jgi:protein required for attachment to host cells
MEIIVKKSDKTGKKYMAVIDGKKTIHFGQAGASDFTIHKDLERKQRYINRHKKRESWDNPETAGFWAKNLLWNKETLKESINDINKKYNINARIK